MIWGFSTPNQLFDPENSPFLKDKIVFQPLTVGKVNWRDVKCRKNQDSRPKMLV